MSWKEIIKEELGWPKKIYATKEGKVPEGKEQYLGPNKGYHWGLIKVIGKQGIYTAGVDDDAYAELRLTVEEAHKLKDTRKKSGGVARQYKGNDPRNPYLR